MGPLCWVVPSGSRKFVCFYLTLYLMQNFSCYWSRSDHVTNIWVGTWPNWMKFFFSFQFWNEIYSHNIYSVETFWLEWKQVHTVFWLTFSHNNFKLCSHVTYSFYKVSFFFGSFHNFDSFKSLDSLDGIDIIDSLDGIDILGSLDSFDIFESFDSFDIFDIFDSSDSFDSFDNFDNFDNFYNFDNFLNIDNFDNFRNFLTTFWQLFDNFLTAFWQLFDNSLTTFWQLFDNFLITCWQLVDNFLTTFSTTFWQLFNNFWQLFDIFLSTFGKLFEKVSKFFQKSLDNFWQLFDTLLTTFPQLFDNFFLPIFLLLPSSDLAKPQLSLVWAITIFHYPPDWPGGHPSEKVSRTKLSGLPLGTQLDISPLTQFFKSTFFCDSLTAVKSW